MYRFARLEFSLDALNARTNFNFGTQNTPAPATTVGQAGYYGNDNGGYYANSNRDPALANKDVTTDPDAAGPLTKFANFQSPNSNVDLQNT